MRYLLIILLLNFLNAELIKPENLDTLSRIYVLFEWEQELYASEYNLQISLTDDFNNLLLDTILNDLVFIDTDNLGWNNQYFWRVKPIIENDNISNWINAQSFFTSNSLSNTEEYFLIENHNQNLSEDAITLFSTWNNEWSVAYDRYGKEIWNSNHLKHFIVNVGDYSELYGFKYPDDPYDGYYGNNVPMKTNFNHDILISNENLRINRHDCIEMPNENFLLLKDTCILGPIPIGPWTPQFQSLGYIADGETFEFSWCYQKIIEVDSNDDIVWEWNFSDYFNFDEYDNYGGTWDDALQRNYYDWTHSNSIFYDEEENTIYLSVRHLSKIIKIDYTSGNVIFNIGLSEQFGLGNNICTDLGFSWQHDVKKLENGNLLFFDNGNLSNIINNTDTKVSRILQIEVIDNNNCNIIYEYHIPQESYSSSMGSVQLLDNNNYLISARSQGDGHIFEINSDSDIVWSSYVGSVSNDNYRAFNIPSIHPEAYSVIFDNLKDINLGSTKYSGLLLEENNYIDVTINNKSELKQEYQYQLSDNINWFDSITDTITIEANESITLTFQAKNNIDINNFTEINFIVTPVNHQYAKKEFNFYASNSINNDLKFNIVKTFPNPFNSRINVIYDIPYESKIELLVYNLNGQLIDKLINQNSLSGRHEIQWDASNYSSGIYFLKLKTENIIDTQKITLIK